MLDLLKISELRKRRPEQLSGGQRQRVALVRSLAKQPKLLLLDEPLGALDKRLRENTQFELVNIQERLGITFIIVTHDQEEAMTMSTRIAIMDAGQIMQVDTPTAIYEFPTCRFVAEFIGSVNCSRARSCRAKANGCVVDTRLGCAIAHAQLSAASRWARRSRWRCVPRRCVSGRTPGEDGSISSRA